MNHKKIINYTSKDFDTIKSDLVDHARRYYPNSYNDFREGSFGSLIFDSVAYVGDSMSFYLDYKVNESFLDTAIEYDNVRKHAKRNGYNFYGRPSAYGIVTFYCIVPAAASGLGPNLNYIPRIKTGTKMSSNGGSIYTLTGDVDFADPTNPVVVARVSETTGRPTSYAIRAVGQVKSGQLYRNAISIGSFQKFRRENIGPNSINEILSVYDSEGNRYYEVETLSQNIVYMEMTNKNARNDGVKSIMKPFVVPRRFTVEQDNEGTFLVFGNGSDDEEGTQINVADPASAAIKLTGRNYITDKAFDPSKLLDTNALGVAPQNTTINVVFSANNTDVVNVPIDSMGVITDLLYEFPDSSMIDTAIAQSVLDSFEITNDEPIIGNTALPSSDEIKLRTYGAKASQNRAVTRQDYESYIYLMPAKFGSVKRAAIINDPSSSNRRLSVYVISTDGDGNLQITNDTVKNNLKVWLNKNKMLNDSIDIYDPYIINIGFTFYVNIDQLYEKTVVLNECFNRLQRMFDNKFAIGEAMYTTDIYKELNRVEGVIDTTNVEFKVMNNLNYATSPVSLSELLSSDGTFLKTPKNAILEIKFPNLDIKGIAK
jgi:hypothetical protein